MLHLNKKGFALAETLIVTVFVATIFTMLYTNFIPMFGEYERRETYDDVDSIYRTYVLKRMFENSDFRGTIDYDTHLNTLNANNDVNFINLYNVNYTIKNSELEDKNQEIENGCSNLTSANLESSTMGNYCKNMLSELKVVNIYLTTYSLEKLKKQIKEGKINTSQIDKNTQDYIDSLPYYTKNSSQCEYRIIVVYAKEINKETDNSKRIVYSFSTIGVDL